MKVKKIENEIRKSLAKVFQRFGLRDVDACILAELFIVDREISVSELSERIEHSISGVTSAMHRLMRMHLVVRDKKGHAYLYKTESNLLSALLHLIEDVRMHEIKELKNKLNAKEINSSSLLSELRDKVERADEHLTILVKVLSEFGGDKNENSTHS